MMVNMKSILVLTIIILVSAQGSLSAEQVFMRNGDRITGRVHYDDKQVGVTPDYAETILLERSTVQRVEYVRDDRPQRVEDLQDEELKALIKNAPGEKEYPEAGAIYLLDRRDVEVIDGRTFQETSRQLIRILKERSKHLADVTSSYYRDYQTVEVLLARSIKPDGSIHYLKPEGVKITAAYARYPLYDFKDILQFAIPEVKEGDIIELIMRTTTERIDLLNLPDISAYMQGMEPMLRSECTLRMSGKTNGSSRFPFRWQLYNFTDGDTPEAKISRSSGGLEFQLIYDKPQNGMIYEPNRPPLRNLVPRLNASFTTNYQLVSREAHHRLQKGGLAGPAVKKLALERTKNAKTDREKVDLLYRMVAYEIKAVGVPVYITQLEPLPPEKILEEKYGGSLDRMALLHSLLTSLGFNVDFLLVRHQDAGQWDREVPCIFDFQQLILRVRCDGEWIYMMEPSEYRPMDILSKECQGAEALLLAADGGELLRLPGEDHYPGGSMVKINLQLIPTGDLQVAQEEFYAGLDAIGLRSSFKNMKPIERERVIRYAVEREMKNTRLTGMEMSDLDAINDTVSVRFNYEAAGFADTPGEGRYLVMRLPFVSIPVGIVGKESRIYDLYQPFKDQGDREYLIQIPQGYKIYHLPADRTENHPLFTYQRKFSTDKDGKMIRFCQSLEVGGGTVKVADYLAFRDLLNSVAGIEREWIVLERE